MNKPKILIRGVNWLGDAVMSLPAIWQIVNAFPPDSVWVLSHKKLAELYRFVPGLDVIEFDWCNDLTGFKKRLKMVTELKAMKFTHTLILPNSFDSACVPFMAGIPFRAGYAKNARSFMLTHAMTPPGDYFKRHHKLHYLELARELLRSLKGKDSEVVHQGPCLMINNDHTAHLPSLLSTQNIPAKHHETWVAVFVGAEYGITKKWPLEYYEALVKRILSKPQFRVLVFGLQKDHSDGQTLAGISDRVHNLAGKSGLRDLILMLSLCDYSISNDSGGMHLSAALDKKGVAIFGSTNPTATGPISDGIKVFYQKVPCSPCYKRTCDRKDLQCLYGITSEKVWETCSTWE